MRALPSSDPISRRSDPIASWSSFGWRRSRRGAAAKANARRPPRGDVSCRQRSIGRAAALVIGPDPGKGIPCPGEPGLEFIPCAACPGLERAIAFAEVIAGLAQIGHALAGLFAGGLGHVGPVLAQGLFAAFDLGVEAGHRFAGGGKRLIAFLFGIVGDGVHRLGNFGLEFLGGHQAIVALRKSRGAGQGKGGGGKNAAISGDWCHGVLLFLRRRDKAKGPWRHGPAPRSACHLTAPPALMIVSRAISRRKETAGPTPRSCRRSCRST